MATDLGTGESFGPALFAVNCCDAMRFPTLVSLSTKGYSAEIDALEVFGSRNLRVMCFSFAQCVNYFTIAAHLADLPRVFSIISVSAGHILPS